MDLEEAIECKKSKDKLISFRKIRAIEDSIADSLELVTNSSGNVHQLIVEAERVRKLISLAYGEMDTQLENVHAEFEEVRKRQQQVRAKVIEQITKEEPENLETITNELDIKIKQAKKAITSAKAKSKIKKQKEEQKRLQVGKAKWAAEAIERNKILEKLKAKEEYERECALREKEEQEKAKELLKKNEGKSVENKSDIESEASDSENDCYDTDTGPIGVHAVTIKPKSVSSHSTLQERENENEIEETSTTIGDIDTPISLTPRTSKVNSVEISKVSSNATSSAVSKSSSKVKLTVEKQPFEKQYKKLPLVKHTKLKAIPLYVQQFKATLRPEEFEQIPKFVRKSESFLELRNFFYNILIPCFTEKYELLGRERSKIHDRKELERWKTYNKQIDYVPGREFITKTDIELKVEYFSKKIKHRLALLIYLGILQDLQYRQNTCYIWTMISD